MESNRNFARACGWAMLIAGFVVHPLHIGTETDGRIAFATALIIFCMLLLTDDS